MLNGLPCLSKGAFTRRRGQKLSEQTILDAFAEVHGNKYRYPPFPEKFTVKSIISIICPVHGEFRQSIERHMRGQDCRKCARNSISEGCRLGRPEWIRRFESVHGRGKYDYSKVPEDVRQDMKIEIYCPEHDVSFRQFPVQHWRRKQGCPKCGLKKILETRGQNLITRREFELRARAVHGMAFEYSELPHEFSLNDTVIIYRNDLNRAVFCAAREHLDGKGHGVN